MNSILETKAEFNCHLTGDFPALPLPHPIGTAPKIVNRSPNCDFKITQVSHLNEQSQRQISHTDSRLKIRSDLTKEWGKINQNTGTQTDTKNQFEDLAKVKPTIDAPLNATPAELFHVSVKYFLGKGVEKNIPKAMEWLKQSANQGYSRANRGLGQIYYGKKFKEHFSQDFKQAFIHFEKAKNQGDTKAAVYLGEMYYKGHGVELNLESAVSELHEAAKQGFSKVQYKLGYLHHIGKGVNQDFDEAIYWYEKAAAQGDVMAQHNLGTLLATIGTDKQDFVQSAVWYQCAAELGYKRSQLALANRYLWGIGVEKNIVKATYWYLNAMLSHDGSTITISVKKYFELITFIPKILTTLPELKNLSTLELSDLTDEANGQMGTFMAEVIQSTSFITCIKAPTYKINSAEAGLLMQSLAANTTVTELILNYDGIDLENRRLTIKKIKSKKPMNLYGPENSMKYRLLAMTQKNLAILELRTYLQNYLHDKPGQPKLEFDVLPSEIMMILADQIIVTNLKKGHSKQATQALLDEFLLSSQTNTLTTRAKN